MHRESLTSQAHHWLEDRVFPGDVVIDATAGNGFDTLFLAQTVGEQGKVFAFDVQQDAIDNTRRLLTEYQQQDVVLYHCSHELMMQQIPEELHGYVNAIMFNLGYLPKGDKKLITQSHTTAKALSQAIQILSEHAVITIIAYPGHPGGRQELDMIFEWIDTLDKTSWSIEIVDSLSQSEQSPKLFLIERIKS